MRILQITKKFPWPVKDGEVIGILNLTRGFAEQGHEVTVLSLNTKKHHFPPEKLPEHIKKLARFIAVDIDTSNKPLKAFLNLFGSSSYNVTRFHSEAFEEKIGEVLRENQFDLILLEGIYLMQYIDAIRENTKAKVLLRPQNVEYIIWQRLAEKERSAIVSRYFGLLAERMQEFEVENMNKADILIPVSEADLKIFLEQGCTLPHIAIPTGYVFDGLPPIREDEENAVAFIGGMDWMPNREGVEWFLDRVWDIVLEQVPDAKLYLAGRNFPDDLNKEEKQGVHIVGEVEDAREFLLSKSILIVPLFAGSGMRVKIVEAMSLGRAIVSTAVGAESLACTDGKDILITDRPGSFARSVIKLLKDQELRMKLGKNAQQLVLDKYDNRKICSAIIDFCKPLIN